MPHSTAVRRELAALLSSYLRGETSISEYLTWEVEFTTSEDANVDRNLTGDAARLSLLGQEYLMDVRPLDDFDQAARSLLRDLKPSTATSEAAGG